MEFLRVSLVIYGIYLAYFSIGMVQPATSSLIRAYFLGGCHPGGPSNAHVFFLEGVICFDALPDEEDDWKNVWLFF